MDLKKFCEENYISDFGVSKVDYVTKSGTELPYAITLVVRLSDAVIDEIGSEPTHTYFQHYRTVNAFIDNTTLKLGKLIESEGYKYISVAASQSVPGDDGGFSGIFSHKKAATLAGLGYIGKSALFISNKFGPRVRLGTVLTDMPFDVVNKEYEGKCGDCDICVRKCPALAIKGVNYQPGMERSELFDAKACSEYMKRAFQHIGRGAVCGICIKNCPKGINKR